MNARVFYMPPSVIADDPWRPGWYWRTEEPHGEPQGPFETAIDAGKAAREAVITAASGEQP